MGPPLLSQPVSLLLKRGRERKRQTSLTVAWRLLALALHELICEKVLMERAGWSEPDVALSLEMSGGASTLCVVWRERERSCCHLVPIEREHSSFLCVITHWKQIKTIISLIVELQSSLPGSGGGSALWHGSQEQGGLWEKTLALCV